MFRFTIRELVLLTLVVAMGVGLLQRQSELSAIQSKYERASARLAQNEQEWKYFGDRLSVVLPGFQNNPHWSREDLDRFRESRSKSDSFAP